MEDHNTYRICFDVKTYYTKKEWLKMMEDNHPWLKHLCVNEEEGGELSRQYGHLKHDVLKMETLLAQIEEDPIGEEP